MPRERELQRPVAIQRLLERAEDAQMRRVNRALDDNPAQAHVELGVLIRLLHPQKAPEVSLTLRPQ